MRPVGGLVLHGLAAVNVIAQIEIPLAQPPSFFNLAENIKNTQASPGKVGIDEGVDGIQ